MNEKKLTKLEASVLGLWLMGMRRIVCQYRSSREISAGTHTWTDGKVICTMGDSISMDYPYKKQFYPLFPEPKRKHSDTPDADIELLPWLSARGITPPEVKG